MSPHHERVEGHACPNCGRASLVLNKLDRQLDQHFSQYKPTCTVKLYCTHFECGVHVTVEGRAFALYDAAVDAVNRPDPMQRAAAELEEQARKCLARAAEIRRGK